MEKTLRRSFCNFLIINLLLFLPAICLVLQDIPQRLRVCINNDKTLSVRVGDLVDDASGGHTAKFNRIRPCAVGRNQSLWYNYPSDKSFDKLCFAFDGGNCEFEITSIAVVHHLFLKRELPLASVPSIFSTEGLSVEQTPLGSLRVILKSDSGMLIPKDGFRIGWNSSATIFSHTHWILIFFAEVVLFFLVWAFEFLPLKKVLENNFLKSALVAILVSFFFVFLLPYQSLTVNRSYFAFSNGEFFLTLGMCFAASVAVLLGILYVFGRRFGGVVHFLFLSLVVYEYLNTGPLAIGEPPLDGNMWYYGNKTLALRNMLALIISSLLPLCLYKVIKSMLHWVALALLVFLMASILDVKREVGGRNLKENNELAPGFAAQYDIIQNVRHSGCRNIMVFVLDGTPGDAIVELMKKNPELQEHFPGFSAYNNIGMHKGTWRGLPSLFTGKYLTVGEDTSDHIKSIVGKDSVVTDFARDGIATYFAPSLMDYGFSNRIKKASDSTGKGADRGVFSQRMTEIPHLNLYEIVRFRLMPFKLKSTMMNMTLVGIEGRSHVSAEGTLCSILRNAKVDEEEPLTFQVFHTFGCHLPIMIDHLGNMLSAPNNTRKGMDEVAYYVFETVGNLFDVYRKSGVYDNSLVILTADHGNPLSESTLPKEASALLWVKPENAAGALEFSETATSHANIKQLLLSAKAKPLTRKEIETILMSEDRVYREDKPFEFVDWHIDTDNNIRAERISKGRN